MTDYTIFYQKIEEIALRFNRWMTIIEIIQITGLCLSIIALVMLVARIRKERKGRHL